MPLSDGCTGFQWAEWIFPSIRSCCEAHDGGGSDGLLLAGGPMDNTLATFSGNWTSTTNLTMGGNVAWAYSDTWDELRISVTANIEGSTSAQRGYFYVYGMV